MKQTFNEIKKYAYKNDTNCCTIIATAIAFEKPFRKIQMDFFKRGYRTRGKGFNYFLKLDEITKTYNYNFEYLAENEHDVKRVFGRSLTPNNCTQYLDLETYLIGIRRHVFAVKNGIVEDWTKGRKHKITEIVRVTPIKKVKDLNISKPKYDFSEY